MALGPGAWAEMDELLTWFRKGLEEVWRIDIAAEDADWRRVLNSEPNYLALEGLPFALTLVLFASARQAQEAQRWPEAASYFDKARESGAFFSKSLMQIGLRDAETGFLGEKAERFRKTPPL